jgi:hypothetical protein
MLKICNCALCLSIWRFRLPFLKRDASAYDHFSPWTAKAKAIAKADTTDEAKIARIQKMVDAGTYKVDASAIADKLVDEQLLMAE